MALLYERSHLTQSVRTVPFEWYAQGRERILNLRLVNDSLFNIKPDPALSVSPVHNSLSGGLDLAENKRFSAKLKDDTLWTPLGVLPLDDISPGGFIDFDLKLFIPLGFIPPPGENGTGYYTAWLNLVVGEGKTSIQENTYESFSYSQFPYSGSEIVTNFAAVSSFILNVFMFDNQTALSYEEAGIFLPI